MLRTPYWRGLSSTVVHSLVAAATVACARNERTGFGRGLLLAWSFAPVVCAVYGKAASIATEAAATKRDGHRASHRLGQTQRERRSGHNVGALHKLTGWARNRSACSIAAVAAIRRSIEFTQRANTQRARWTCTATKSTRAPMEAGATTIRRRVLRDDIYQDFGVCIHGDSPLPQAVEQDGWAQNKASTYICLYKYVHIYKNRENPILYYRHWSYI